MVKIKSKKRKWILSLLLGVFVFGMVATVGLVVSEVVSPAESVYAVDTPEQIAAKEKAAKEKAEAKTAADSDYFGISAALGELSEGLIVGLLSMFSAILAMFIELLGWILSLFIVILQTVAEYGDFREQPQVIQGWMIVRDVVNSFFIVVLIAIAIATIIRVQAYHFKSTLPKLIVATFLVNFSRTICLLAIDFSQAIMMTFINALKGAWPVFVLGLRAPAATSTSPESVGNIFGSLEESATMGGEAVNQLTIIASEVLGILTLILASAAILFFVIILLYRILMLWILMIFSPLAFFLWGAPGKANTYWGLWFGKFVKEIIVGPVIAFFLYVDILFFINNLSAATEKATGGGKLYGFDTAAMSGVASPLMNLIGNSTVFFGYIVGLALMFVTLEVANEIGAAGTSMAQKARGKYLGAIKGVAGGLRDYTQSKMAGKRGLSYVAPLLSPGRTYDNAMKGLKRKQNRWVREGRERMQEHGKGLEGEGKGFRAMISRGLAGDQAFFEKTGLGDVAKRSVKGVSNVAMGLASAATRGRSAYIEEFRRQSASDLETSRDKFTKRENIRRTFANDEDLMNLVGGMNVRDLKKNVKGIETAVQIGENQTRKAELESNLESVFSENPILKTDEEIQAAETELQQIIDTQTAYESEFSEEQRTFHAENTENLEALTKARDVMETGYDQTSNIYSKDDGITRDGTVGEVVSNLNDFNFKKNEKTKLSRVNKEMGGRMKQVQDARSSLRAEFNKGMMEYVKETYPPEDEIGSSVIANNIAGHKNPENVKELAGDYWQAAKQGDLPSVLAAEDIEMTLGGMQQLHTKLTTGDAQMESHEAMELVNRIQKLHYEDGRYAAGSFTKRGEGGKIEFLSPTEHNQKVKDTVKKRGIERMLKSGKKDAFGHKDKYDKFTMHEGVKEGFKEQTGQLKEMLKSAHKKSEIPHEMWKMLSKNATDLGIDSDTLADINKLIS